jgi:hypothetical protein
VGEGFVACADADYGMEGGCVVCADGEYSEGGYSACESCPENSISNAGKSACIATTSPSPAPTTAPTQAPTVDTTTFSPSPAPTVDTKFGVSVFKLSVSIPIADGDVSVEVAKELVAFIELLPGLEGGSVALVSIADGAKDVACITHSSSAARVALPMCAALCALVALGC